MSVLETPRIFFKGQVTWDPIVTNNYGTNYDEDTGETILPAAINKVKAFRRQAIDQVTTAGNWNPHGSHRSTFYDTAVCGFDLGAGVRVDDPFVSAAVNFTGMLVDLEPFGAFSSQLFYDTMRFGVDGGYRILAPRTSRFTARYINFFRNSDNTMIAGVASVIWQASFAKSDGLRVDPFDSAALRRLAVALNADDVLGLTVRFNAYRTVYFDNPNLRNGSPLTEQAERQLESKLQGGGFQPNPARSLLVGVIGLWRKGEPAHEPGDRALLPQGDRTLQTAHARLDGTTLTLDLSNSVPEIDQKLTKNNLGTLTVTAIDPLNQSRTDLGSFAYYQYDRAAYEASAGLVTIPLATAPASSALLEVRAADGAVLLAETALRAAPSTPNLYLAEGQSATASFQVYDRGAPAATQLPVTVYTMSSDGGTIEHQQALTTDANGVLRFPISRTNGGGIASYVVAPDPSDPAPAQGIDPQVHTYMYVRTLPADADVGALPPTWPNVYDKVLANWNAMAPCMDNWLMLDDQDRVKSYANVLKRLTDPANFENYRFMPVTRDMTAGERALLYKFLDAPDAATAAKTVTPQTRSFTELSRAMRRGGITYPE
jgi:hypothetical protein